MFGLWQCALEINSGTSDLFAAVQLALGTGIDFSSEQVIRAREHHPEIEFIQGGAHDLFIIEQTLDVAMLSDLVNGLWDAQQVKEAFSLRTLTCP